MCAVGVLGKASRFFPQDAAASLTIIHREQQKAAEDLGGTHPDLARQDAAWASLPLGFGNTEG